MISDPRSPAFIRGAMHCSQAVWISLTKIVREKEVSLPHRLSCVDGLLDEIVDIDTGSMDRTAAIAREFGARAAGMVLLR